MSLSLDLGHASLCSKNEGASLGPMYDPQFVLLQNSIVSCRVQDSPYFWVAQNARATVAQNKLPILRYFWFTTPSRLYLL